MKVTKNTKGVVQEQQVQMEKQTREIVRGRGSEAIPHIERSERYSFAKVKHKAEEPDLLEVQIRSFHEFFQIDTLPSERKKEGLFKVFSENFPVTDSRENFVLEFLDYSIDPPPYSPEECKERGLTYSVALKAKLYLYSTDPENDDFEPTVQTVFLGNIPNMTPQGTFIINGAERTVVSQIHRSPGVFFSSAISPQGIRIYSARVIPYKGAWIEFSTDTKNVMYAYVDRKKKFPITVLLRVIGYPTDRDILKLFNLAEEVPVKKRTLQKYIGRKIGERVNRVWQEDYVDEETGEISVITRSKVLLERQTEITEENIDIILESGYETILVLREDESVRDYAVILNTLQKDGTDNEIEAARTIHKILRGTEAPDDETARDLINKLYFSEKRYDLGEVGRFSLNKKLHKDHPEILESVKDSRVLTREDIVAILNYLVYMMKENVSGDDVDHLRNRRVRTIGEHLYLQFSAGLSRLTKTIRERMNIRDNEVFKPQDLVNPNALTSVINSFFGTSQLSQFLDHVNLLSEMTHKRRVSAMGPGGLSREHAGFEVRDVHYSHYGRLCPIETPEGANIGLISSLATYARINRLGFIETPYWRVVNGKVDFSEVVYLSPEQEQDVIIAPANIPIGEDGTILAERVEVRKGGDYLTVTPDQIHYMDVATNQITSVAASLIPFLEHDDANRALMGSNMQRQAVPLLVPEAPIVGTGMERVVVRYSRRIPIADIEGVVVYVDANEIHIKQELSELEKLVSFDEAIRVYRIPKFQRTNQNTCLNLRPIVKVGDRVVPGTVLCDGFATDKGELALGKNLLVAFMPWNGYNFEDAIVISERLVREDVYTSIHIEEFETQVRETKLGPEELTREIPNVNEEDTKHLDEDGIVRIGAEVKDKSILIGKITPKGSSDPTPEEKLLRAIFGDKAGDVRDASLKAPPSFSGIVIDKKLFSSRKKYNAARKERIIKKLAELEKQYQQSLAHLDQEMLNRLERLLEGKTLRTIMTRHEEEIVPEGKKFKRSYFKGIDLTELDPREWTDDPETNRLVERLFHNYKLKRNEIIGRFKRERNQLKVGDDLPTGVLELAKVYVARKRRISVGDKMAGRHGNKGVVAKIARVEDMPFLEDGTPVDIVLNPLGVPSRMNIGQIYETLLGWAGAKLGVKFATPVFDGATEAEVEEWLQKAGLPSQGITYLYDGLSGERFHQPATVGVIYMMKLNHLVDDKMHARSTGPYQLVTQQPLGGKSQFGGQRFGEMEVWALEAFGAAHILREMLTVKSDDVEGRQATYEAIVKRKTFPEPNVPESFTVLVNELRGLALDIIFD